MPDNLTTRDVARFSIMEDYLLFRASNEQLLTGGIANGKEFRHALNLLNQRGHKNSAYLPKFLAALTKFDQTTTETHVSSLPVVELVNGQLQLKPAKEIVAEAHSAKRVEEATNYLKSRKVYMDGSDVVSSAESEAYSRHLDRSESGLPDTATQQEIFEKVTQDHSAENRDLGLPPNATEAQRQVVSDKLGLCENLRDGIWDKKTMIDVLKTAVHTELGFPEEESLKAAECIYAKTQGRVIVAPVDLASVQVNEKLLDGFIGHQERHVLRNALGLEDDTDKKTVAEALQKLTKV